MVEVVPWSLRFSAAVAEALIGYSVVDLMAGI
jgi:hypothetical protein